jgi:hypothetical protein
MRLNRIAHVALSEQRRSPAAQFENCRLQLPAALGQTVQRRGYRRWRVVLHDDAAII